MKLTETMSARDVEILRKRFAQSVVACKRCKPLTSDYVIARATYTELFCFMDYVKNATDIDSVIDYARFELEAHTDEYYKMLARATVNPTDLNMTCVHVANNARLAWQLVFSFVC